MTTILRKSLIYLNLFAMLSTVLPYLMLSNTENIYHEYIYLLLVGFISFFFQRKVIENTKKIPKRLFLLILESVLFFSLPFFLFEYNIFQLLFLSVLSEITFVFGRKLSVLNDKQILSVKLSVFIWCSNIFIPIICYLKGYYVDITLIFVVSIVLVFSRLFILNFDRIDTLSTDRGHELSDIPTQLRQHNVTLVTLIFSSIVGITLFLENITNTLRKIGLWCFERFKDFLRWLVSKINDELADYEPLTQEIEDNSLSILDELTAQDEVIKNYEYLDNLLFVITLAIIIWLVYLGLKIIIPFIVKFIQNNLNYNSSAVTTIDDDTWTVVESKLVKEEIYEEDITIKQWRKAYKKYIKSNCDFHQGYQLAVKGIYLYEKNITSSYTPLEISNKVIIDKFNEITSIYNSRTYGDNNIYGDYKDDILQVLSILNVKI